MFCVDSNNAIASADTDFSSKSTESTVQAGTDDNVKPLMKLRRKKVVRFVDDECFPVYVAVLVFDSISVSVFCHCVFYHCSYPRYTSITLFQQIQS